MSSPSPRHFLDLDQLDGQTLRRILDYGVACKAGKLGTDRPLAGKSMAMIFEKPSTRTRVSFEIGMFQMGGGTVMLGEGDSQLGRGETIADTARVLSRFVDVILMRTSAKAKLDELAGHADVPVINGLTDFSHPCQVMADIMTFEERLGSIAAKKIAWVGDGNNVAASWIHAAKRFGFQLHLACPGAYRPAAGLIDWAQGKEAGGDGEVVLTDDVQEAVADADCIVTDTWVSMGDDAERAERVAILSPYRVDQALMDAAKPEAIFMHCLPAHRGEEVVAGVIDGERSAVWDEAENRLHAQKGVLAWCLGVA